MDENNLKSVKTQQNISPQIRRLKTNLKSVLVVKHFTADSQIKNNFKICENAIKRFTADSQIKNKFKICENAVKKLL